MATIWQIQDTLMASARIGDLAGFTRTVDKVLPEMKPLLDSDVLGRAFDLITGDQTQPYALRAATAMNFLSALGGHITLSDKAMGFIERLGAPDRPAMATRIL